MKIVVLGGGYVGQLIQYAFPSARVLDAAPGAPLTHRIGPQYLWEPIPGLPCREFTVTTLVDGKEPTTESIWAYKRKIGKEDDGGDWGLQFQHRMTGYDCEVPKAVVEYGSKVMMVDPVAKSLGLVNSPMPIYYDHLVSTIPLPVLLRTLLVGPTYADTFKNDPIHMQILSGAGLSTDMELNYNSDPRVSWYRRTYFKTQIFYESLTPTTSVTPSFPIYPGKIHPHPESEQLVAMLKAYDIHCFGRFATWRPDELAHETWKLIEHWKDELK